MRESVQNEKIYDSNGIPIIGLYGIKFATLSATITWNTLVVASVSTLKIRVHQYLIHGGGTVNAKFQSNTTDITGLHYLVLSGGAAPSFSPVGLFETSAGQSLNINLSLSIPIGGWVV